MPRILRQASRLSTLGLLLVACATPSVDGRERAQDWAQPMLGDGPSNWHRVSRDLYRCGQPSRHDMHALEAHGIASVVNLREHHSDIAKAEGTRLAVVEVPLDAGDLSYEDLVRALAAVASAPKPTVVHCWRGSDRTGAVVAAWRIAVEGWTPHRALDEMVAGGFGHSSWYGNLRALVGGLDPERLRQDLAMAIASER